MSMKAKAKHKPNSLNSEPRERPVSNTSYSRFHHSNQRPPAGKPLFNWNQHTRPNLIVIQPVPLDGTEAVPARSAPAAQVPPAPQKLLLPQDRWCPQQGQDSPASSGTGQSKRRASGKFSHFESSSESEESDDDLLLFGSNSSRSDASVGHSSDDDDQNSLTSRGQSTQEDCLDGCLSESTSDLQVSPSPRHETMRTFRADCADQPTDACSAKCTTLERSGCDGPDSGGARTVPPTSSNSWGKTSEDEEAGVTFAQLRTPRKQLSPGSEERSSLAVPSESALALPMDSPNRCGLGSTGDSPRRQQERIRSPVTEDREERKDDPTLENGANIADHANAADSRKDDRLAPPLRDTHGSREGTPGSSRSVDSQERSASHLFEARRRKFESREPVKPEGGKIVLLKGQARTEGRSRDTSPLPSPPARTRSRSRSRSDSPPLLRSVLSVVKRGPAELFPSCVDAKKKRRSGRTVEIIVHSVGDEESSDTSDRAASSKLPVHLRLGESPTKKKKSKRKRSSRDLACNSAKRKHAKARRSLNSDGRWPGPDNRRRHKALRDAPP